MDPKTRVLQGFFIYLDVNQPNSQGQTPLHLAIIEQQVAALCHLILLGCNAETADYRDVQPVHLACELDDAESLRVNSTYP